MWGDDAPTLQLQSSSQQQSPSLSSALHEFSTRRIIVLDKQQQQGGVSSNPRRADSPSTTTTTKTARPAPSLPTTSTTNTTFSFCLLIKDDNEILSEWIAYHYHLWNLRQLIVAVDPTSATSPQSILDAWHNHFGLNYELWNDSDYLPTFFLNGQYDLVPRMIHKKKKTTITRNGTTLDTTNEWQPTAQYGENIDDDMDKYYQVNNHRYRQSKFLQHCAKYIQDQQQQSQSQPQQQREGPSRMGPSDDVTTARWMTHVDTDEYMTLNPALLQRPPPVEGMTSEHGDSKDPSSTSSTKEQIFYSRSGGLVHLFEEAVQNSPSNLVNWPCISMPRILYGSLEDESEANHSTTATDDFLTKGGWNRTRFESLRWKYHAPIIDSHNKAGASNNSKQPKVLMDITGFPPIDSTKKVFSIHRPSLQLCRMNGQISPDDVRRYPIVVRHYLGSYDRYISRQDPRRSPAMYKAALMGGEPGDTNTTPTTISHAGTNHRDDPKDGLDQWLPSFVATYGIEKASRVLSDYRTVTTIEVKDEAQVEDSTTVSKNAPSPPGATTTTLSAKPLRLGIVLPVEQDSMSACLLIKDDNDILPEWLAYHYHVLKLRTIIVAVDPQSNTSPATVLETWRDFMDDIHIWHDSDYMPSFFLRGEYERVPNLMGNMTDATTSIYHTNLTNEESTVREELKVINVHRFRQSVFLTECIRTFKYELNKTWVMHIDTDEYIALNPKIRTLDHWRQLSIDPVLRKDSLFTLLKDAASGYSKILSYPCLSLPRLLYGSKEDVEDDRFSKVPTGFVGSRFETLRWKFHSNYDGDQQLNGKPKTILDLSGLPPLASFLQSTTGAFSIHRPAVYLCQSDRNVHLEKPHKFPLTIQHYIGSWERYNHRDDARRSRAMYESKALVDAAKDDGWIDGWVANFVQTHGMLVSQRLLSEYMIQTSSTEVAEDVSVSEVEESSAGHVANVLGSFTPFHSSDNRNEFSACLLVKDDNDILNEWIGYHYHVLGLRYLIVAVDSTSTTSPAALLDKWRTFGMTIEEWQDSDFMPDSYFQKAYHLQPRLVKIKKNKKKWLEGIDDPKIQEELVKSIQDHRFRQITFLSRCASKLQNLGRTWMIHIDTDEYVVVNPKLRQQGIFDMGEKGVIVIPPTVEDSIVPRLLNEMALKSGRTLNYPCISLPRLLFGSIEDSHGPSVAPIGYNQSRFESLRWKYHSDFDDSSLNKQPKVIMDVSAISPVDKMFVDGRVFSIHRPSQELCRTQGQMVFEHTHNFPFSINHYLGTFERFGSRNDPRRNRKLYDQKANTRARNDHDHWVESWLPSFIKKHGEDQVSGVLRDYRSE